MKNRFFVLILGIIGLLIAGGVLAVLNLPNSTIPEQASNGYATPISGQKDIILADASCRKITSTTATQYFVPTRTQSESNSFFANPPSGVTTAACAVGNQCTWLLATSCSSSCAFYGQSPVFGGVGNFSGPSCTTGGGQCLRCYVDTDMGQCGTASGTTISNYPTLAADFCAAGTKSDIDTTGGDGRYNWKCSGNYNTESVDDMNCSAAKGTLLGCNVGGGSFNNGVSWANYIWNSSTSATYSAIWNPSGYISDQGSNTTYCGITSGAQNIAEGGYIDITDSTGPRTGSFRMSCSGSTTTSYGTVTVSNIICSSPPVVVNYFGAGSPSGTCAYYGISETVGNTCSAGGIICTTTTSQVRRCAPTLPRWSRTGPFADFGGGRPTACSAYYTIAPTTGNNCYDEGRVCSGDTSPIPGQGTQYYGYTCN